MAVNLSKGEKVSPEKAGAGGLSNAKPYHDGGAWHLQAIGEKGTGRTFNDMMPLIGQYL